MKWRPDNWENPYRTPELKICDGVTRVSILTKNGRAYEAGADAMLKALRAKAWFFYTGCSLSKRHSGCTVFIPDEEDGNVKRD